MTRAKRLRKKTFKRLIRSAEPALLAKLERNERKYKFGDSWKRPDWKESCQYQIATHVQKGDPTDVVILGLMAMFHKWATVDPEVFIRASGDAICEVCGNPYKRHVFDMKQLHKGEPWLTILCGGIRVKL